MQYWMTRKAQEMLERRFNLTKKQFLMIKDFEVVDEITGAKYPNVANKFGSSVKNSAQTREYWICERLNLQAPIDNIKQCLITFYPLDGSYGYDGWSLAEKEAIRLQREKSSYNVDGTNLKEV